MSNRIKQFFPHIAFMVLSFALGFWGGKIYFQPEPHADLPTAISDSQFLAFTDEVISIEGGWKFHDGQYAGIDSTAHPNSPLWSMDLSGQPSEQIRNTVYTIYMMEFFKRLRIADLPPEIAFCVYDFGINAGARESALTLQRILFTDPAQIDGHIGLFTIGATQSADGDIVHDFTYDRVKFYAHLALQNPEKYGADLHGWIDRAKRALNFAQGL